MSEDKKYTDSGIEIKKVYSASDLPAYCTQVPLEMPGKFPYTRGVQEDMYRGKGWTMRQ
ncbi:MAG: methylmalonyl-CoA mutase, partial [Sediminibacterium sp.]|nr:methylmalonyl-CoA mutase [Sediminibacterium sp.]